ncbi:recombinase family protein [Chitinimonas taiwanensis]|uniref:Site-specific DNA recombinase n=1 Tax=Chitinimonas taiwanensis DSM 18899 TaxID=1121279 RepID=A0A1K2HPS6_9NEIS|nr:recombinase family protein [Chitinimonas taiwanensis]SFZ78820.1 Site-specific DNA recombinase [Chitinimonas taiwanensis DSM 18899]
MLIGYARVSTQEQETHLQIDALKAAGCDVIIEEKRSGGSMSRPMLFKVFRTMRRGDTVVVYKIDRIARSLKDLLVILERMESRGVEFRSLTEVIDTTSPAGRMILQIIGAFAEFERELIRERTINGLKAAAERGAILGRPRGMTTEDERECVRQFRTGQYTKTALAKQYGVHISSVKRALARASAEEQPDLFNAELSHS